MQDTINVELRDLCYPPADQKLIEAAREVLLTGRLTPLIKEELKCKIQSRRLSMGQDEMKVDFKSPQKYQLSTEEQDRRTQRKERNRVAAKRHRQKKKEECNSLERIVQELEKKQKYLLDELSELTDEKKSILEALSEIHSPPV